MRPQMLCWGHMRRNQRFNCGRNPSFSRVTLLPRDFGWTWWITLSSISWFELMTTFHRGFCPFPPWSMVFCHVDDVEKVVALLLREAGDKLDQEVRAFPILPIKLCWNSLIHHLWLIFLFFLQIKDVSIAAEVFRNYSFFENVMKTLLRKMGLMSSEPDHLGPQASYKTQIAVTCEVRSGLVK